MLASARVAAARPTGCGGDDLPTPAGAWARVASLWRPYPLPEETVALAEALGRVTARDIRSPIHLPPFDRAAMDGYAVRAADCAGPDAAGCAILRVGGEVPMGRPPALALRAGEAIGVATGSMIPRGADAVVNVERTVEVAGRVRVAGPVHPGDHIVPCGSYLARGEVLLTAGRRLRPQDIAALGSVGLHEVAAVRRPRVAVLVTGDELRLPGEDLAPGQIHSANGVALAAQVRQAGGQPEVWDLIPDDSHVLVSALRQALAGADLVLLSGGRSVGTKELTLRALEAIPGATALVQGVAVRPGRPTIVAEAGGRLMVGIPGNPFAAMVAFLLFGRPAIRRLLRLCPEETDLQEAATRIRARLREAIASRAGREDYIPARVQPDGAGGWLATPLPSGAGSLSGLVRGAGLIAVPPGAAELTVGEEVVVILS